jgi:hypothetical protein
MKKLLLVLAVLLVSSKAQAQFHQCTADESGSYTYDFWHSISVRQTCVSTNGIPCYFDSTTYVTPDATPVSIVAWDYTPSSDGNAPPVNSGLCGAHEAPTEGAFIEAEFECLGVGAGGAHVRVQKTATITVTAGVLVLLDQSKEERTQSVSMQSARAKVSVSGMQIYVNLTGIVTTPISWTCKTRQGVQQFQ